MIVFATGLIVHNIYKLSIKPYKLVVFFIFEHEKGNLNGLVETQIPTKTLILEKQKLNKFQNYPNKFKEKKLPEEDIKAHINPSMTNVAIVIRGHSTDINANFSFKDALKPFFLPCHSVIDVEIAFFKGNSVRRNTIFS